jgi:membrane-associated phospholipid phosphatase
MGISPTILDLWLADAMAGLLGRYPLFDLIIQSGIRHQVFGGFIYGAALYLAWIEATRSNDGRARLRLLTILVGSTLAVGLTVLASQLVSWPPPIRHPDLAHLYPTSIEPNPNHNCFPSQSTALYMSVAFGLYSLRRAWGIILGIAVLLLVSLPRMYVGGHYLSDVLASIALAAVGYTVALGLLEKPLLSKVEAVFTRAGTLRTLAEMVIFVWIYQVTVGFREGVWVTRAVELFVGSIY